jgi:hypothetical protein
VAVVAFNADGACLDDLNDANFPAGAHSLWQRANSAKNAPTAPTVELEILDLTFPMRLPEAQQSVHLGDGRAPQVFTVTASDGQRGPDTFCEQPRCTPSFVVDADADNVLLSVLDLEASDHVSFDVLALDEDVSGAGRGESADGDDDGGDHGHRGAGRAAGLAMRCDLTGEVSFRRMHGRFAVFVKTAKPSLPVTVMSRRADVMPDLFWSPSPIPVQMSIAGRVLGRHYPLLRTVRLSTTVDGQPTFENVEKFFLESPLSLFVTVDGDIGALKRGVLAAVFGLHRAIRVDHAKRACSLQP